jgi:hypothetical protein
MDKTATSRDSYRQMAKSQLGMIREYLVAAEKRQVNREMDTRVPITPAVAAAVGQNDDGTPTPLTMEGCNRFDSFLLLFFFNGVVSVSLLLLFL